MPDAHSKSIGQDTTISQQKEEKAPVAVEYTGKLYSNCITCPKLASLYSSHSGRQGATFEEVPNPADERTDRPM